MMEALTAARHDFGPRMLYKHDFPDWFVTHAESYYNFDWDGIIRNLRNRRFFYPGDWSDQLRNITGQFLDEQEADELGEVLIQRLAALVATVLVRSPYGELVRRELELNGFRADERRLSLLPLEGPVSETEEEELLAGLIKQSTLPSQATVLKHLSDARSNYVAGGDHASLNESRSFIQALIDDMATETGNVGGHAIAVPGGTANRIKYLQKVGFFTQDEKSAFCSAWGTLSAGSHPGVPARHEARIGLILALEFGQLLILKFVNWKKNGCRSF